MKNSIVKKSLRYTSKTQSKSTCWIWIVVAFFVGLIAGVGTHYLIVNWNSFFVTCPDGNKPDKNGCCNGEIYTDAGDGWMVCCPKEGDNCFPPIK